MSFKMTNRFLIAALILFAFAAQAKKIKIAFYISYMALRGTQVATYDYADFNETILGNESIIINYTEIFDNPRYDAFFKVDYQDSAREKFVKRFGNRFFDCACVQEINEILKKEKVDIFYIQKGGEPDKITSNICKNVVHAVFNVDPHADAYAAISNFLIQKFKKPSVPVVPYIVRLDSTREDLRQELGIPHDAIVFGRHGGITTFDISFAADAVREMAQQHPDWYFVFLNTNKFCDLKNVKFLTGTADLVYKTKFINSCDAMIHARIDGETFGLAPAEFSIKNKPVITCLSGDLAHVEILGNKGFYYTNKQELIKCINYIADNIKTIRVGNWDCYSKDYRPEVVMKKFDEIFIQPFVKQIIE